MEYRTLHESSQELFDALLNLARREGWTVHLETFRVVGTSDPYSPARFYVLASRSTAQHGDAVTK